MIKDGSSILLGKILVLEYKVDFSGGLFPLTFLDEKQTTTNITDKQRQDWNNTPMTTVMFILEKQRENSQLESRIFKDHQYSETINQKSRDTAMIINTKTDT